SVDPCSTLRGLSMKIPMSRHAQSRHAMLGTVATVLLVTSPLAMASEVRYDDPSYSSMAVDALVARPLGLGATIVGTALWIVTLPFSALGGNVGEAADRLIIDPAHFTFTRPLGEL
ncbi:MAG: hypothetical protein ABIX37_12520, partial [Gammaproteobacteria bacterium]